MAIVQVTLHIGTMVSNAYQFRDRSGTFGQLHGFTLIELLVVIAIISLLVSILLPSLQKAKELAKSTICMSNVRSCGMTIQLYLEDNDGNTFAARPLNEAGNQTTWSMLMNELEYIDLPEDGHCEGTIVTCPIMEVIDDGDPAYTSEFAQVYGFVVVGQDPTRGFSLWNSKPIERWSLDPADPANPANPMTNFESAGEFILLGDSVYYLSSPLIQYCRLDMTNLGGGKVIPHTRHGGKGNYLLGDGSVSQFGGDELIDDYLYSSYLDENGVGYGVGF